MVKKKKNTGGPKREKPTCERKERAEIDNREANVVMFIPYTPMSKLKKSLQEMEENLKFLDKVRYVETIGPTIES